MGRKPIGKTAMSGSERTRLWLERKLAAAAGAAPASDADKRPPKPQAAGDSTLSKLLAVKERDIAKLKEQVVRLEVRAESAERGVLQERARLEFVEGQLREEVARGQRRIESMSDATPGVMPKKDFNLILKWLHQDRLNRNEAWLEEDRKQLDDALIAFRKHVKPQDKPTPTPTPTTRWPGWSPEEMRKARAERRAENSERAKRGAATRAARKAADAEAAAQTKTEE